MMNSDTTTLKTLAVLYGWFCEENGYPTTVVSDNGPQFTADMFKEKMKKWGIKHKNISYTTLSPSVKWSRRMRCGYSKRKIIQDECTGYTCGTTCGSQIHM